MEKVFKTKTKDERLKRYKKNIEKIKGNEPKAPQSRDNRRHGEHSILQALEGEEMKKKSENMIVKRYEKPVDANFVNNRCRYWIEQRISQLLNNDNFTTRGG